MENTKAFQQHYICKHCGKPILQGTYFKYDKDMPFHIECYWDKEWNHKKENKYEKARKFFFDLESKSFPIEHVGEEDLYERDLETVKSNDRIIQSRNLKEELQKSLDETLKINDVKLELSKIFNKVNNALVMRKLQDDIDVKRFYYVREGLENILKYI